MKTSKKNGFLTFCLSLMPGAAHMYMGFMKMGLSLMSLFFIAIAIGNMLRFSVMALVSILVWVYSFFQANNLSSLADEDFAKVEDKFIFESEPLLSKNFTAEKGRKYFGIGLIVLGTILIWNISMNMFIPRMLRLLPNFPMDIFWRIRDLIPQLVAGIIVIGIGTKILRGKTKTLPGEEEEKLNGE
ncbi:MAG: hypothetical protein FWE14_05490 [Lachnospiraceae bacterium]|nr:hypothetical protein [Lachnospiraceae bacterium]